MLSIHGHGHRYVPERVFDEEPEGSCHISIGMHRFCRTCPALGLRGIELELDYFTLNLGLRQ